MSPKDTPDSGNGGGQMIETQAVIIGAGPVGLFAVFELGLAQHFAPGRADR